jgi:hypothetical protein
MTTLVPVLRHKQYSTDLRPLFHDDAPQIGFRRTVFRHLEISKEESCFRDEVRTGVLQNTIQTRRCWFC